MKRLRLAIILVLCFSSGSLLAQDSLVTNLNIEVKHKVWATILTSYYTTIKGDVKPKSAFEMPTALFGYSATFSNQLKATLIYDVSRTTNDINATDQDGNPLNISFNEGSKYTAYLKMAEIKYSPASFIDLRIGQLLNTQYLTTQDKFWGYRYIYFTYQEVHRYGNPADFGAQVDLKYGDKLLNQISVTNGEGPFKKQDENGKFLYSNNLEVYPVKGLILKLYADYSPKSDTAKLAKDKYAISAFAGYKTNKFRVAVEYNKVFNYGYRENSDYYGFSTFGSYTINPKFDVLVRYDYINRSATLDIEKSHLIIAGLQYQPIKNLLCSVNVRNLSPSDKLMVYGSFGITF
ncbi:MAG: hypothetical protein AB7S48_09240 [Bacteroidales bacterium]